MKSKKKIIANLLLVILGFIMAFLILEVVLRVHNPFVLRTRGDKIVLPANVRYDINNDEALKIDRVVIHTKNSLGFRGEEPPADFDNHLTIIAIGGSTTESLFLSDDKEWTHVLGKRLEDNFQDVWINNGGLDGHTTFGHIVLLEDYVVKLKPKIVLYLVGINDVGAQDLKFHDKKMLETLNTETLTGFVITLANNSEVLTLVLNIQRMLKARNLGLIHDTEVDLFELERDGFEVSSTDALQAKQLHIANYLGSYQSRLEELVRISRVNGMEPVFITQPVLYGDATDDVTNVNLGVIKVGETNGIVAWEILELYNGITREVGENEGVMVIDLARKMPKSSRLYYDLAHYTNDGAKEAARFIHLDLCPFLAQEFGEYLIDDCNVKERS